MLQRALKMLRVYHHISQKTLAENIDISNSHLSELESGKKTPSLDVLKKYSQYFNIPVSSILLFSENLSPDKRVSNKIKNIVADKVLKILEWVSECDKFEKSK